MAKKLKKYSLECFLEKIRLKIKMDL